MDSRPAGNGPGGTPPVNRRAERAVLGALLILREARYVDALVGRGLKPEDFYWSQHAAVFRAIVSLAKVRTPIDPITVAAELGKLGGTEAVTSGDIDEMSADVPATAHLSEYAKRVMDLAEWRRRRLRTYEMVKAIQQLDDEAWMTAATTLVKPPKAPAPSRPQSGLRLVVDGESGEVLEEERHCPKCQKLQDQLDGATTEIQGHRTRYANLRRNLDERARADGMWQTAQRLFGVWQDETGHKRSPFTADRFYQCEPYLRNRKYGPEMIERAIAGLAFDPFVTTRRNGTKKKHDGWELIFRSADKFEEYVNRAPKNWKPKLAPQLAVEDKAGKVEETTEEGAVVLQLPLQAVKE